MGHGIFPDPPAFARDFRSAGVTGTNGKTSTTAYLAAALARPGASGAAVVRVTTVGTFLGERRLDVSPDYDGFAAAMATAHAEGARLAALEMTSAALAMGFAGAWPCDVAVFTNLTRDHLDAHGSAEHYLASKAQLFVHLREGGTAVLHAADPASALLEEVVPRGRAIVRYAIEARVLAQSRTLALAPRGLTLAARGVQVDERGTSFELVGAGAFAPASGPVRLRAHGEPHVENALAALGAAVALGAAPEGAVRAIEAAAPPPGRFQIVARAPLVVVDYAHSPDALARVLETARAIANARAAGGGRVTVVFGAGGGADVGKRPLLGAAACAADRVIVTTDNPRHEDPAAIARAVVSGMGQHARRAELRPDRARAIRRAVRDASPEDVVVIAGKGHEATQEVRGELRRFSDVEVATAAAKKQKPRG